MEVIQQIGAFVGLAAFFGLAVLALLYFAQAREVRRLQERAAFLPEDGAAAPPPARAATAAGKKARKGGAATAQPGGAEEETADPGGAEELEAARLAQLAREAAAERRKRFESRRRGESRPDLGERFGGREMPEPRALVVIVLGVILLGAGVIFGAGRILGGDEEPASGGGATASKGGGQESLEVAVLNGTPVPGAAADTGDQLRKAGFELGAVTNSSTPFPSTVVMFDQGSEQQARQIASELKISDVRPIDAEIKGDAEGAPVVVIVGDDRASGSSAGSSADAAASGV